MSQREWIEKDFYKELGGFDEEAVQADPSSGIGLRNMRERVAAIGGTLNVRSDGAGTSVVADVPTRARSSA